jgi:serralysin
MTIWDGGGNDTYDLSNYGNGTTIDLRPGQWTTTSQTQIADLGDLHDARGNIANALLYNGDPRSLIENAISGSGNDTLIANQAANHLTGGGGADNFRWAAASDAGTGALADTITDFVHNIDKIDFSLADALPLTATRDAFSFIDQQQFHNVAGEVRWELIGGVAHIFADADGNGVVDMEIIVNNNTILTGNDFVF